MRVLAANPGSSSVKLSVIGESDQLIADLEVARPTVEDPRGQALGDAVSRFAEEHGPLDAAGVRVVHGGDRFVEPVLVTPEVRQDLGALVGLAPLHQGASLAALDILAQSLPPATPVVACFDTAFHQLPPAARTMALPPAWTEGRGLRRFGFHGLSHAYVARRAGELLAGALLAGAGWRPPAPRGGPPRIVSCHLGAGASVAAIAGDRSVETTMSFTPLDGLVMATRPGTLDPGAVLWLLRHGAPGEQLDADRLEEVLEHGSGLAGLSGIAGGDLAAVLAGEAEGDDRCALAAAVYLHRLRTAIGAMTAALSGLDVLVFTAGAGERSPELRRRTCEGLGYLGVALDPAANEATAGDVDVSAPGAAVRTLVVHTREDLEIARGVRALLAAPSR